ncbi:hypothetical protein BU15DRAFT_67358, partial [Melanogaster broomeanus]
MNDVADPCLRNPPQRALVRVETYTGKLAGLASWSLLRLSAGPEGHSQCSSSISNLANALQMRFEQRGDGKDLDEAIGHHQSALQLTPEGHPQHSSSLDNLASALRIRFELRGDEKDLDEAIEHHQSALQLTPEGHPQRSSSLNNIANALRIRFEQQGDGKDLDEAIKHYQSALQLRPKGHPQRSSSLNSLASALRIQFEQHGGSKALDEAIEHYQNALQLRPEGHPEHCSSLNDLASALQIQFLQHGDEKDLHKALQLSYAAVEKSLTAPSNFIAQWNLAELHLILWRTQHVEKYLQDAMCYYKKAAEFAHTNLFQVLSQHHTQKYFPPDLAVNAASCALHQADIYHAVELLEQGRALHWTQIAHFRTSLEHL